MVGKEEREAHGKGGSRGEHPAVGQAGGAMGWMRWEWAWSITHPPQHPPSSSQWEHHMPKPIKCSRSHQPTAPLPPARRSEESVLICCLLITSDPALIPPKTSPESLRATAGEPCPPARVTGQPGTGDSPGPSSASGRDARGWRHCVVMEEAPCAPPSCSSARWS